MRADDDAALLHACRAGETAAWEALVLRYQRLVYAIPRRAGLAEDAVADVFQQVFVTLLEHLHRIEQPHRLGAWLTTTARRESLRQLRRARAGAPASGNTPEDDPLDQLIDPDLLPDEVIERLEQQHSVRQAVAALDERCRTLLTMLFFRDEVVPYTEIAAALGVPAGSIGPTRARCLKKVQALLEIPTS